jgi:putative transcriptional regulator
MAPVRSRAGRTGRVRVQWPARLLAIRHGMGLSQRGFATLISVSLRTLQNWEQGRRQPSGPAAVLLTVLEREPEAVIRVVQ